MNKRFLPIFLALALTLSLPVTAAVIWNPESYEEHVAMLQNDDFYSIYDTIDTALCTVFHYQRIGVPHIVEHQLAIIYKPGSPQGDGAAVYLTLAPEAIQLSENGKQIVCTGSFSPDRGTEINTVDLTTGEIVKTERIPPTQEEIRKWFVPEGGPSTLETRLEAPDCSVVLFWDETSETQEASVRSYYLYLFYRDPESRKPEPGYQRLILPSTVYQDIYSPTGRAPDALFLNEDGSVLTYIYRFEEALYDPGGNELHGAGTYIYQVDIATGTLSVEHTPLSALGSEEGAAEEPRQTYEQAVAELRNLHYNINSERTYETDDCTIFIYDNGGVMRPPHNRIAIIYKANSQPGEGVLVSSECPYGLMLYQGPDRLSISEDGSTLIYAFLLEEDIDAASLKAGIYTYTVDLPSGITTASYAPLSYEGLADVLAQSPDHTLETRLDGPCGSAILRWSDCISPDEQGNPLRDYELYLVSKDGEPTPRQLLLPSTSNTDTAYSPTHQAPDSMAFHDDGKSLVYTYTFDSALMRGNTLLHDSGTYTYTVSLPSGDLSVEHTPLPPSGLGAEGTTFVDVAPSDWFAQGVATCAREGIMVGTGEDTFSPEATLTYPECVMLAYRLYEKAHGGDGTLLKAPEDWGYMTIDTDDGRLHHEGFSGDSNVWGYTSLTDGGGQYIYVKPKDTEMLSQFHNYYLGPPYVDNGATVTLEGTAYHGTVVMTRQIVYQTYYFTFRPNDPGATDALIAAQDIPAGDKWWRDLAYTVRQRGLEEVFSLYPQSFTAIRHNFADQLAAVTDLPQRFAVEAIPDLNREDFPQVFRLYEAGILGGTDDYGTFSGGGELTRAEAAVMVARVLDESQRLKEPPKPMPAADPERYTLTYLAEGHILHFMSPVTFPLCPIYRSTEEAPYEPLGLLTLEGELLPWTAEGMELSSLERQGPYLTAYFQREEPDYQYTTGVLDGMGQWIVAPGEFESVWPRAEGFGASSGSNEDYRAFLLDSRGQVLAQTDREDPALTAVDLPVPEPWGGLTAPNSWLSGQRYYQWPDGSPASGWFDNCGELGPDGQGFVEKDGKVYRIQFTEKEE